MKATKRRPAVVRRPSARYLALIRRFPLRPIQSEAELDRATALMDELLDADALDAGEQDYLDVLSDLTERYEARHHAPADVSEGEMLAHLIEARGVSQVKVARETGIAESTVSAVLSGKRQLTREQIVKLAGYFRVTASVFLPAA